MKPSVLSRPGHATKNMLLLLASAQAADNETNELLFELHAAVLKNLAQARLQC